jgi:uncharacterized protein (DUF302 family)
MKIIHKCIILCFLVNLCAGVATLQAASPSVFAYSVEKSMPQVYGTLYKALEDEGYYVVFEANLGRNLARFAHKWGENYNRRKLDAIRSMVFCNGWYANQVSNLDPSMLALCPLSLTLIERQGKTTVLFARPTVIALNSPAHQILERVEKEVIEVIKQSLRAGE